VRPIAEKIGGTHETLRRWRRKPHVTKAKRPGTTTDERERLKALERENAKLRRANEILRKASVLRTRHASTAARSDDRVYRHASRRISGRIELRAAGGAALHRMAISVFHICVACFS
jgi:transposase-like protein